MIQRFGGFVALILATGSVVLGADEARVARQAAELLEEIAATADSGIPPAILREAQGITIVPALVETQLGVGHKRGDGVFLPRDEQGHWGPPQRVRLANLTVGAEVGHKVQDVVILYRTRQAADHDANQLMLGADFNLPSLTHRSYDPHRFYGPKNAATTGEPVLRYYRGHGRVRGVRLGADWRTRADPPAPAPAATTSDPAVPPPASAIPPAPDSPEVARLRAALDGLTARPGPGPTTADTAIPTTAAVAARPTGDPLVQPATRVDPVPVGPATTPR